METAKRCVGGQIRQLRLGLASPSYGCRTLLAAYDWSHAGAGRDGAEGQVPRTGPRSTRAWQARRVLGLGGPHGLTCVGASLDPVVSSSPLQASWSC